MKKTVKKFMKYSKNHDNQTLRMQTRGDSLLRMRWLDLGSTPLFHSRTHGQCRLSDRQGCVTVIDLSCSPLCELLHSLLPDPLLEQVLLPQLAHLHNKVIQSFTILFTIASEILSLQYIYIIISEIQ